MTKGQIIELIILRVNGGRLTNDTKVRREDVEVLLSAAINYALLGQYTLYKRETGDNNIPEPYIATYPNVETNYDQDRELYYIDLPSGIMVLPKNYGLQSVSPMKGVANFVQTNFNDRHHNQYYTNSFRDVTLFWMEGDKVYFQNLPTGVDKILVRLIQSFKELEDDDELAIPGGLEIDILKLMTEWFAGQRSFPADMKPDNSDNTNN